MAAPWPNVVLVHEQSLPTRCSQLGELLESVIVALKQYIVLTDGILRWVILVALSW